MDEHKDRELNALSYQKNNNRKRNKDEPLCLQDSDLQLANFPTKQRILLAPTDNFCPQGEAHAKSVMRSPPLHTKGNTHCSRTHAASSTHCEWTVARLNPDLPHLFSIHASRCCASFSHLTRLFHQTELPASLNEVQLLITPAPLPPPLSLPPSLLPPPPLSRSLLPWSTAAREDRIERKKKKKKKKKNPTTTLSCAGNYLWSFSTVKKQQPNNQPTRYFSPVKLKRSLMQWVTISSVHSSRHKWR